jgi:hypothetical protein
MFSTWSVQSGYKEEFIWEVAVESSVEKPACQDMRLGAEELNWVESSDLAAAE